MTITVSGNVTTHPNRNVSDRVANLREAAGMLGLSLSTLKRCGQRGELKILQLSPRRIGVRMSEIQRFLESRAA